MADFLLGRVLDAPLDEAGYQQAQALGHATATGRHMRIQASPRLRTRQTAAAIAQHAPTAEIEITPALDEVDFGEWAGRSFADLDADPRWQMWNQRHSQCSTPTGESMATIQQRALGHLHSISDPADDAPTVLVTHAEIIRAVVLFGLGMHADDYWRIDISPASVTVLQLDERGMRFECINQRVQSCNW